ncbi:MAG TPA: hypothetical protein VGB97_02095 [Candidatus Paceibacterota bacterium]
MSPKLEALRHLAPEFNPTTPARLVLGGGKQYLLATTRSRKPWPSGLWPSSRKEKEFGDGFP